MRENVPVEEDIVVDTVSVLVPVPPELTEIVVGFRAAAVVDVEIEVASTTEPVRPLRLAMLIVASPEEPMIIDRDV
jgi:hypothetical protein